MTVFKRPGSKFWQYEFVRNGRTYRGSTKEVVKGRAQAYENMLMARIQEEGPGAIIKRSPVLSEYAKSFINQCEKEVAAGNMRVATWKYYRSGWKLLSEKKALTRLRLNEITTQTASVLTFPGGPSNAMVAIRTLRRILNSAVAAKMLKTAPDIKGVEETGRTTLIEPWIEARLLKHADPVLADIIVIMADTGMRPGEVMSIRLADILWDRAAISVPKAKTSKRSGIRYVPLSERVFSRLSARAKAAGGSEWLFPSPRAASGHRTTVKQLWSACVILANRDGQQPALPKGLVLYCGRHTFATDLLKESGNVKLVKDTLGHADLKTTMKYLHPDVGDTTEIINARNRRREMKVVEKVG